MHRSSPLSIRSLLLVLGLAAPLSGCSFLDDTFFGEAEGPPLPGERVPALQRDASFGGSASGAISGASLSLPAASTVAEWPVPGGNPAQLGGHPALESPFERVWSASIGAGGPLINPPIVVGGRVYATDAAGRLTALDAASGAQLWRVRVATPEEDGAPVGGGVASDGRLLYVTTGFGEVVAVDPENGALVWKSQLSGPIRGAPMVAGGRVYAITIDNRTEALDAATGASLWAHNGILEASGVLGGAAPTVGQGVVLAPYSSGEIYALRQESGRAAWSDSLTSFQQIGGLGNLADIRGAAILADDIVIVTSHSGRTAGIDLRTGSRIWDRDFGGVSSPWVAGDAVFLVTLDGVVVALNRRTGAVSWRTQLPRYRNPDARMGAIAWAGPVLAGNALIAVSSEGQGVVLSPSTGAVAGEFALPRGSLVAPIIASDTLYIVTNDGTLTAYR